MLCIKIHKSYRTVVALCDANLLGKRFESGIFQLEVRESFFKEREITREECILVLQKQAREDATFNIVGKEAVETAREAGIINEEHVSYIQTIPFTLLLI
ncbi:DUF424 family protein [Candidatus Pacearchaeota archaeon]|nr:DUF424 family protein [Candidatus Pacearchaeota archaeon]